MVIKPHEDINLSHLAEPVREIALQSNEERIEYIRRDRWFGYPRANQALERLRELLDWPEKQRMPNLLIVGPTNNGKSMIIEKFRRENGVTRDRTRELLEQTIVAMQMPSDPTPARFYAMLLTELGAPVRLRARLAELEQLSVTMLKSVGARMLIVDELHNLLSGSSKAQREFLNLIRFLGNQLRIPIVGVGTREAYFAIRSDDQLENRFEPIVLPTWSEGEETSRLLASFARTMPLQRPSNLGGADMARYVLARSEGTIGEMTALLSRVAIAAIQSGEEAFNKKAFEAAEYRSPSARRRSFERQLAS